MKRSGAGRRLWRRPAKTFSWGLFLTLFCGCGAQVGDSLFLSAGLTVSCDDERYGQPALDVVVIDWSGGVSDLVDAAQAAGLDFEAFVVSGGGTIGDQAGEFKAAVRDEVARILCSFPEAAVHVENGEAAVEQPVTKVYVAQEFSPNAAGQIGEGDYDPCNVVRTNDAIVYGEELLELGEHHSLEDWIHVFANVIAHEIGHTLGYGHIERDDANETEREFRVELMYAVHTAAEMVRPQRYLADESNCSVASDRAPSKRIDDAGDMCGVYREE